jgi:hypothetical protein
MCKAQFPLQMMWEVSRTPSQERSVTMWEHAQLNYVKCRTSNPAERYAKSIQKRGLLQHIHPPGVAFLSKSLSHLSTRKDTNKLLTKEESG